MDGNEPEMEDAVPVMAQAQQNLKALGTSTFATGGLISDWEALERLKYRFSDCVILYPGDTLYTLFKRLE